MRTGEEKPCKEVKKDVSFVRTPDKEGHPPSKAGNKKIASSPG